MKRLFILFFSALLSVILFTVPVSAAVSHTVVRGDTMWRLAVKYEVGLSEIRSANPQISNPDLIYPGQILTIPTADAQQTSYEKDIFCVLQ